MRPFHVLAIFGLVLLLGPSIGPGQENKKEPERVFVPLDGYRVIEATGKKVIREFAIDKEDIVQAIVGVGGTIPWVTRFNIGGKDHFLRMIEGPPVAPSDTPSQITLRGNKLGSLQVTLTDKDGGVSRYLVEVRRELALPVGVHQRLEFSNKAKVQQVVIENEKVVEAIPGGTIQITIKAAAIGESGLKLIGKDGITEDWKIFVRSPKLMLAQDEKHKLRMSKQQNLTEVINESNRILKVEAVPDDPTTVLITAQEVGISRVVLVAGDSKSEIIEVGVKPKNLAPEKPEGHFFIPLHRTISIQMESKKAIKNVHVLKEDIVQVVGDAIDPSRLIVRAVGVGDTAMTLEDVDGKKEKYELVVRRGMVVPLGVSMRVEAASKKAIDKADSSDVKVARVRAVPGEPKAVEVEPVMPGGCFITLIDKEGKKEEIRIAVTKVQLLLEVGETQKLQISTKAGLKMVCLESDGIVELILQTPKENVVELKGDARCVLIKTPKEDFIEVKGVAPGAVQVFLTDKNDKAEVFEVGVKTKKN